VTANTKLLCIGHFEGGVKTTPENDTCDKPTKHQETKKPRNQETKKPRNQETKRVMNDGSLCEMYKPLKIGKKKIAMNQNAFLYSSFVTGGSCSAALSVIV